MKHHEEHCCYTNALSVVVKACSWYYLFPGGSGARIVAGVGRSYTFRFVQFRKKNVHFVREAAYADIVVARARHPLL